jgi:hypothetical protein
MFGGRDASNTELSELWEWSILNNNACWTNVPMSGAWPAARRRAVLIDDGDRGRLILFGGEHGSSNPLSYLGDTWEHTGTAQPWIDVTTSPLSLGPRSGHGGAYDAARGQGLVFGGHFGLASNAETWLLARGENHRPSLRFTVSWDVALVPVANIEQVTIVAHAGGRGYSRSAVQHRSGAALRIWDSSLGRWWTMRENTASFDAPGLLTYDLPGEFGRRHVSATAGSIDVMVTSAHIDYGQEQARFSLDDIEIRVQYRL